MGDVEKEQVEEKEEMEGRRMEKKGGQGDEERGARGGGKEGGGGGGLDLEFRGQLQDGSEVRLVSHRGILCLSGTALISDL